jgi:hypothetical protein
MDDFPFASPPFQNHGAAPNHVGHVVQMKGGNGGVTKELHIQICRVEVEIRRRDVGCSDALKDLPKRCLDFCAAGGSICSLRWKIHSRVVGKGISKGFPVKIREGREEFR